MGRDTKRKDGTAGPHGAGTRPAAFNAAWVTAHFQPQLCCDTGAVTGFEALARLRPPGQGVLLPASFLPGLSPPHLRQLTRTMLGLALEGLAAWAQAGFPGRTVALNVSVPDLADRDFADFIMWELDRLDIPPAQLVIEVMEDICPVGIPAAASINLDRLAAWGCGIDLDDFGSGFAGLQALWRLPVQRIKIDRSFVSGCDRDGVTQQLIAGIVALADQMGLKTLAEGVETPAQHGFLAQIGCSHVQGYAIARPMPLAETVDFLARHSQPALPELRRRA